MVALLVFGFRQWIELDTETIAEITATVARAELPITVTERGELESSKNVNLRCEVEGRQIKVVEILPEGSAVKTDDVLIRFDTEELSRTYAEQEIKVKQAESKAIAAGEELEVAKNKAAGELAKAKLALDLAELDHEKYLKGDYIVEEEDLQGAIKLAEHDLQDAETKLVYYRKFQKKGFGTLDGLRQRELAVEREKFFLQRDKAKLNVLQNFTRERQVVELTAKAEDTKRDVERVQRSGNANIVKAETDAESAAITAKLEGRQLEKLKQQLDRCVITAPQNGILVYSKERYWDPDSFVRPGAMVHYQQKLVSLPDLSQMQVKVKVHESVVKKVQQGQTAEIRVDAYPNQIMKGTVESVATLANSTRSWRSQGVKEYETIITIDEVPTDGGIKPGMTAEVKILVGKVADALVVPVSAVTANEEQYFAYVVGESGVERRSVTIGESNTTHVEVKEGLVAAEKVALDARARMDAELKDTGETNAIPAEAPTPETVTLSQVR